MLLHVGAKNHVDAQPACLNPLLRTTFLHLQSELWNQSTHKSVSISRMGATTLRLAACKRNRLLFLHSSKPEPLLGAIRLHVDTALHFLFWLPLSLVLMCHVQAMCAATLHASQSKPAGNWVLSRLLHMQMTGIKVRPSCSGAVVVSGSSSVVWNIFQVESSRHD